MSEGDVQCSVCGAPCEHVAYSVCLQFLAQRVDELKERVERLEIELRRTTLWAESGALLHESKG